MSYRKSLPGFNLSMGYTLTWLSLIVLIPLAAVFIKTAELTLAQFWVIVTSPRVVASYRLTFGASLAAAAINAVFGLLLAWSLVRYTFPGKKIVDSLVDLPFALPTAVAGIALTALWAGNDWVGSLPEPFRIKVAFTPPGVLPALVLSGLMLGAVGMLLSSTIRQLENFAGVMNFVIFPTFFLSSALYPLWKMQESSVLLFQICSANPFTHAVELIRFALYAEVNWESLGWTALALAVFLGAAVYGYNPARGFMPRKAQAE